MNKPTIVLALLATGCTAVGEARIGSPAAGAAGGAVAASPAAPVDLMMGGPSSPRCVGAPVQRGGQTFLRFADGSLAAQAPLRPVADGAPRAYHPDDRDGGAIMHRCNAGEVFRADGDSYEGAASNATCTGRFERDAAAIHAAGWRSGRAGAIRWHGVHARGSASVAGRRVPRAEPIVRDDGYYTSRTALTDDAFGAGDPRRYADAATVPYAVVRRDQGVPLGSHGVAWRTRGCPRGASCEPVPFVVADYGPRAGAGSLALSYRASGLALPDRFDFANRFRGAAGPGDVLTVFFGDPPEADAPLDAESARARARAAFEAWGGEDRLYRCRRVAVPPLDVEAS